MNNHFTVVTLPANFWSKSWKWIMQLVLNGIFKSAIVIGSYFWIKDLSSELRQHQLVNIDQVLYLLVGAALIIALRTHERFIAEKMSQRYINSIRSSLLKRLMRVSIKDIQNRTIGNLSSRLAGDLSAVKRWVSLGISRIITHSILLTSIVLLIFSINNKLGMLLLITLAVILTITKIIGQQLKFSIHRVRKNRINIHSLLVERLASIAMIRSMGNELNEVKKINSTSNLLETNVCLQGLYLGLLRGLGDSTSLLLISLFFIFSSFNTTLLSADEITALIGIVLFINSPLRELGRVQEYYQGAKLSINKIQELYNIPRIAKIINKQTRRTYNEDNIAFLGSVNIKGVYLKPIFSNLSFSAKRGDHIALTGRNGSGKSTLMQLMLGLIKADSGEVKINGIASNTITSIDKKEHIGCSGVNMGIMKCSLKKNLCYRKPRASIEEINELLIFCQLDEFVNNLQDGLLTKVKENGRNFSSGEVARISLFRALLGSPEILMLDEPENYLDTTGFELIKKLLLTYEGTIIVATHNEELINLCNKEWALERFNNTNKLTYKGGLSPC